MRDLITDYIKKYVCDYAKREGIDMQWGEPIVGFADARHPAVQRLKDLIGEKHALPQEAMPDASIVISYFVPFTRELAKANNSTDIFSEKTGLEMASPSWARAYEVTNAMFGFLNAGLIEMLKEHGYKAVVPAQASAFDQERLISYWSQRHLAYAAGLGTFGVNNMLITKQGCCGRYSSVVTNLDITPDSPLNEEGDPEKEHCLFKKNGSCGVCMRNCPVSALMPKGFDRYKCYEVCLENALIYNEFGSSYTGTVDGEERIIGSEVCGKCVTGSPCAFWKI